MTPARRIAGALWAGLAAAMLWASPGAAQEPGAAQLGPTQQSGGAVRSPVLTIDTDRLFRESLFGQRVLAELSTATEELAAENRRIEAELTEEVQSLTERRPTMAVEAFRAEADAFDARVQAIRAEQDAKEFALQETLSTGQDSFLATATPILGALMIERGAAVILDRRTVFLSVGVVDITEPAIAAIDAEIGDGTGAAAPDEPDAADATEGGEGSAEGDDSQP